VVLELAEACPPQDARVSTVNARATNTVVRRQVNNRTSYGLLGVHLTKRVSRRTTVSKVINDLRSLATRRRGPAGRLRADCYDAQTLNGVDDVRFRYLRVRDHGLDRYRRR
jgi:hypothetical protein